MGAVIQSRVRCIVGTLGIELSCGPRGSGTSRHALAGDRDHGSEDRILADITGSPGIAATHARLPAELPPLPRASLPAAAAQLPSPS